VIAMLDISQLAARQLSDYDAVTPGTLFADSISLSEEQAYDVQTAVCYLRQARGENVAGYKVGCTSPTIQHQLEIDHPVFGRVYDSEYWLSGATLSATRFCGLAIEGELAVRLARDLTAPLTNVGDAIESVFPIIELHNLVFRGERKTAQELIANNALQAGFVAAAGSAMPLGTSSAELTIEVDGESVDRVAGPKLMTTVTDSLHWLAAELSKHDLVLKRGQTILCGSVAKLIPIPNDCHISVTTDRFGTAECRIDSVAGTGPVGRQEN